MANPEHLEILRQGVEVWNKWRRHTANSTLQPDFRNSNLSYSNLSHSNLSHANFSHAHLRKAILRSTNFEHADLRYVHFRNADISNANLSHAYLNHADFSYATLSHITLSHVDLRNANLYRTDLSYADLSRANLNVAQLIDANLTGAVLTGACIANWQISSSTNLEGAFCDYIFRTIDEEGNFSGRLPVDPNSIFAPGEFTQRFQILASALETIDLTFTDGIDWQAFFRSFQELRSQYPDTDISIQGMERKVEGFIVRLEVNQEADKAIIEIQAKQLYADQLQLLEAQYEERLRLQGAHLEDIRGLLSFERQERTRLSKVVETMASEQKITQNFHGPVGNVAGTNYGSMTAYINQNSDDISRLLSALRETAQQFPEAQKDEALMELEDLEADLKAPEKQEPKRIRKRLQRLMAAGTAAATFAGGAATFSGDINEFTGNVLELAEKVGLARDAVQP